MLNIPNLMSALAEKRPVFHSEADLQHALAWEIHRQHPEVEVRLEYPTRALCGHAPEGHGLDPRWHVDIWLRWGCESVAMELKYAKKKLTASRYGELYELADGTNDVDRYDFLKDIGRLERLVGSRHASSGYALVLANDSSYWLGARAGTLAAGFDCCDGRCIGGNSGWHERAGEGTKVGREEAIKLEGTYPCRWMDYSQVEGANGTFRYLLIEVPGIPVVGNEA